MKEVNLYQIEKAEIKREKNGCLIVGFSSQRICNDQLIALNSVSESFFLGFYSCDFSVCDLREISSTNIKNIGVFHSSFGDDEIKILSDLDSLESIKLHDTNVTSRCIFELRQVNNKLLIST